MRRMKHEIQGNPDFGELSVTLDPGEKLLTESGAMNRMSAGLEIRTRVLGGVLPALARKLFGGESLFIE